MGSIPSKRKNLQELLFPRGIPPLWCPPLTHFDAARRIDLKRMEAHLAWMMPHVKGYLVPGSTGDGWDLDDAETETVVRFAVDMARKKGVCLPTPLRPSSHPASAGSPSARPRERVSTRRRSGRPWRSSWTRGSPWPCTSCPR